MKINPEFKSLIPELSEAEYKQLETNIIADGCRDSLVIWNDTLIDGHNRLEICTENNISFDTTEMEFDDESEVKVWIIKNAKGKRNLSDWQKYELEQVLKVELAKVGKEKERIRKSKGMTLPNNGKVGHDTQQEVAKILGWSHSKVAMADKVKKEAPPEVIDQIKSGEISINKAYQDIKKVEKNEVIINEVEEQKNEIEKGNLPVLENKYHVISIDPPWPYELKLDEEGEPIRNESTYDANGRRAANKYPEMSIKEISEIDLPVADDSVVWLWTTHKFLPDAFNILKAWGLEYKATMVWDKEKIGLGHWLRMQCEFCLLATKGKPVWDNTKERDILRVARREHSRKPDEFFNIITEMCRGAKLEYFSREQRDGWDTFGNDMDKFNDTI
jgi:N6-adenosine-specific RNA methylase IME4